MSEWELDNQKKIENSEAAGGRDHNPRKRIKLERTDSTYLGYGRLSQEPSFSSSPSQLSLGSKQRAEKMGELQKTENTRSQLYRAQSEDLEELIREGIMVSSAKRPVFHGASFESGELGRFADPQSRCAARRMPIPSNTSLT